MVRNKKMLNAKKSLAVLSAWAMSISLLAAFPAAAVTEGSSAVVSYDEEAADESGNDAANVDAASYDISAESADNADNAAGADDSRNAAANTAAIVSDDCAVNEDAGDIAEDADNIGSTYNIESTDSADAAFTDEYAEVYADFADSGSAEADEPSDGCVFLGIEGRFITTDAEAALARINEIRKEACEAGNVPDPRDKTRMLQPDDYVPVKWSTDLESVARVRAKEAAITIAHARLNDKTIWTVKSNGIGGNAENLAWNGSTTMVSGINQFYEEKAYWVNQNSSEVTGHYTSMINPKYNYVGLGDFYSSAASYHNTLAMRLVNYSESKTSVVSGSNGVSIIVSSTELDETIQPGTSTSLEKLEVAKSFITGYKLSKTSYSIKGGAEAQIDITANVSCKGISSTLKAVQGLTYNVADSSIVSVSSKGVAKGLMKGSTTVDISDGESSIGTVTVTVTSNSSGTADDQVIDNEHLTSEDTTNHFENWSSKSFWYENGERQGTLEDSNGVMGDGTVRGREIYDPKTDGWYWLDAEYCGAKAVNKEVWMPYIYQDELNWGDDEINANAAESGDMAEQVKNVIKIHQNGGGGSEGAGKWVRYDDDGKMYKGWLKITGDLAELYPTQSGNTYYYDLKTGLMAKGDVKINGTQYHFDETTGALVK